MGKFTVNFVEEGKKIQAEEGMTLLEAQRIAGLQPDAPCGGSGKCGKCQVKIKELVDNSSEDEDIPCQSVLACQTRIHGNVRVFTQKKEKKYKILTQGKGHEMEILPSLKALDIIVPKCKPGESTSDWDRFLGELEKKAYPIEKMKPTLSVLEKLTLILKEDEGRVQVILGMDEILDVRKSEDRPVLMAAFDIGTTSVAGYLLDGNTGKQLSSVSEWNTQAAYGADVITRANYTLERGTAELSAAIHVLLKKMLEKLCEQAEKNIKDIYQVCVVGNTCMHHLFLGITPKSLVLAPYHPVISQSMILEAKDFGLGIGEGAQLLVLPVIAGFVGADTIGCLLAADMEKEEKMTLMIDIGTNGEIVLGNKERRIACSTAAGPAFEGAKISCGMRGAEGAIEHVFMENKELKCSVIHGEKPAKAAGICGSGLIDLIAVLLDEGMIDEMGRLQDGPGIIEIDGMKAYLLFDGKDSSTGAPVYLSQKDISELQLAKGAMAAGIGLLCEKMGISVEDIEQVYIAGAFGNYMRPESACRIGLIPSELKDRITGIGNAAGEGAKMALLNKEEYWRAQRLARTTEFLELASMPEFQDRFIDEMEFPEE